MGERVRGASAVLTSSRSSASPPPPWLRRPPKGPLGLESGVGATVPATMTVYFSTGWNWRGGVENVHGRDRAAYPSAGQ